MIRCTISTYVCIHQTIIRQHNEGKRKALKAPAIANVQQDEAYSKTLHIEAFHATNKHVMVFHATQSACPAKHDHIALTCKKFISQDNSNLTHRTKKAFKNTKVA